MQPQAIEKIKKKGYGNINSGEYIHIYIHTKIYIYKERILEQP